MSRARLALFAAIIFYTNNKLIIIGFNNIFIESRYYLLKLYRMLKIVCSARKNYNKFWPPSLPPRFKHISLISINVARLMCNVLSYVYIGSSDVLIYNFWQILMHFIHINSLTQRLIIIIISLYIVKCLWNTSNHKCCRGVLNKCEIEMAQATTAKTYDV